MTHQYTEMNPNDALYSVARKYPDGMGELANLMGMTEGMLRNKVSPKVRTHITSVDEFSEIMHLCHEAGVEDARQPLKALNMKHDMVAFQRPISADLTEEQASQIVYRAMKEAGDVAAAVGDATADGKITLQEMDRIEREFQEALTALYQWREFEKKRFEAQVSAGRAA